MKKILILCLIAAAMPLWVLAQHSDDSGNTKLLITYQDSLTALGKKFINKDTEMERMNANTEFIKTLVKALKIPHSFDFPFDSVKSISIVNSPDKHFRMITWHIAFDDGSYRFYGTIQMNAGDKLQMFPLTDYSPLIKKAEDTITNNTQWFGAQYYSIIPANAGQNPYYILLGWKGNTIKSTKKVIEVLSFGSNGKPVLGLPVFDGNGKTRNRVVFEYTRQASMLLKYDADKQLIVFDNLVPPDAKLKSQPESYGPDLSYNGYLLKNGRWVYKENLDMRNTADSHDDNYIDPKKQAEIDKATATQH
ncbi:hypothetical protein ACPPVU_13595 [Mucilaginibacter sp. McL0603]|uniref:hypothetical protein n=1 Tax=Mucilaginibacter sp. McL0603 TaxID=3415670 RepID=UPI003CEAADED